MGPRRITAALAVLALGLLATAGVAAASFSSSMGSPRSDDVVRPVGQGSPGGSSDGPSDGTNGSANGSSGASTATLDDGITQEEPLAGGGVDAAVEPGSVPLTPPEAPAAAVNGPAPAAAAAAALPALPALPILPTLPALPALPALPTTVGATGAVTAPESAVAPEIAAGPEAPAALLPELTAPAPDPYSLAGLPQFGSRREIAASVSDGPSTARALIASPSGRSVAVPLGFLLAIFLFLLIHRRLDRGDRKLATARAGGDVACFR